MAGKSKKFKIQINLTNRWLYTLIAFFGLIIIGVFVYATVPNPGHAITEIEPPAACSADQFLQWDGSAWTCADAGAGGGLWGQNGSNIYYDTGKVSIGTSSSYWDLHVEGSAYIKDHLGIGVLTPNCPLHVDGVVRADGYFGSGSGLTNLRVIVKSSSDVCDETTHGLLRYISGICSADDSRSSYFDICMRNDDSSYSWYNLKYNTWTDTACDEDGCPPGEEWYECSGQWDCAEPGCYPDKPDKCYEEECTPIM